VLLEAVGAGGVENGSVLVPPPHTACAVVGNENETGGHRGHLDSSEM
jgi:hypothetical protein